MKLFTIVTTSLITAFFIQNLAAASSAYNLNALENIGDKEDLNDNDDSKDDNFYSKTSGNWCCKRNEIKDDGLEILSTLQFNDIWTLNGGMEPTKKYVDAFWVYFLGLEFDLGKTFLKDKNGTFFIELFNKEGVNASIQSIGSYNFVNNYESPSGTQIYSLYYKHEFENGGLICVGKQDAYDYFTIIEHSKYFLNSGYQNFSTFELLPTYPYPMLGIVASTPITSFSSFTAGIYDGSFIYNFPNIDKSIFGNFFNNLAKHAFLIAEFDFTWDLCNGLNGHFGVGSWYNTVPFIDYNNDTINCIGGPYAFLDQVFYKNGSENAAFFCALSATNPFYAPTDFYYNIGMTWQGFNRYRRNDLIGAGVSTCYFTSQPNAGFTKSFETSYEIFYVLNFDNGIYLQPDFQYIQNPGGYATPNASVFSIRLNFDL